jgi:hypothetical protein
MVKLEMFEQMSEDELSEALALWTVAMSERVGLAITIAHLYVQSSALSSEAIAGASCVVARITWDAPKST